MTGPPQDEWGPLAPQDAPRPPGPQDAPRSPAAVSVSFIVDDVLDEAAPQFLWSYGDAFRDLQLNEDIGWAELAAEEELRRSYAAAFDDLKEDRADVVDDVAALAPQDQVNAFNAFGQERARLEAQLRQEMRAYGEALKTHMTAAAAAAGITVRVEVLVADDFYPGPLPPPSVETSELGRSLLAAAVRDTPTPDRVLAGTPQQRLKQATGGRP